MSEEYKAKNDLPDLYHILGLKMDVCKKENCSELIQKAYIKKAKVCHPDKHPGRKDVEEIFELLTSAYDILKDPKQRNEYNQKFTMEKQSNSDHFKLKKTYCDYIEKDKEYLTPTDQQKLAFEEELAKKYSLDSSKMTAIPLEDVKKQLSKLSTDRTEQDRILKPEKIFEDGRFDTKKFNAAFDLYHQKDNGSIVNHQGFPSAWNDTSSVNYSSFDEPEKDNYSNHIGQNYSNIEFGNVSKITKESIENITGADYVDNHNVLDDKYYQNIKNELSKREQHSNLIDNMNFDDFKRDSDGYGFLEQLGCNLFEEMDDETNMRKRFEKMKEKKNKSFPNEKLN